MLIPTKITKRQATALHKKNMKYLMDDITGQHGDILLEAAAFKDDDRDSKIQLAEMRTTLDYWHKEVKKGFKDFVRDKARIEKAYQRGLK